MGKGILDTAEGGSIAPLVGMDLTDEVKVGPLEELELVVNVGARRQLGTGQGRELLACPRRSGRDVSMCKIPVPKLLWKIVDQK